MSSFKRLMQDHQVCEHLHCEMPNISKLKVNATAAANKGEHMIARNQFHT